MGELLSFPGLGLEFHLNRVAFQIGNWSIAWYGIIMAAAFLAGIGYALFRVKDFGLDGDRVTDVALVAVIGGIIGARIYYVLFSWEQYKDNLIDIFKIWEGGIAIYGGLIGAILVGYLMCRLRRVRILPMLDLASGGVILGQAIGRWGNFVNIEAFGSNTDLPWGMTGPAVESYLTAHQQELEAIGVTVDPSMPVHPTFFYESLWCLIGFVLIALFTKRRRFDGELVLFYAVWYGAERAVVEGLRTDSLMIGNIRVSQMLSILAVLVAGVLWVAIRSKIKRMNDPEYRKLYVYSEEAQLIREGKFYQKAEKKKAEGETADPQEAAPRPENARQDQETEEDGNAPATGETGGDDGEAS